MTNMTWASFQYCTCYFNITCAYSGSLCSYLAIAILQTRKHNSSYFVFIQHWTWCSKFFHYSVYYFTWHCWCRVQGIFHRNFKDLFPWQNLYKYGNWTMVPDVATQRGVLIFKGQNVMKKWTLQINYSSLN